ncbi:putative ribonuclease H-like domain-containing protein [Tanacetum coccineum]|uniref:Ribonuclease H-like domain-containing protein n=1 Tax=Tanacetum coccineum TaxID=301880 RepID=A0ABQ4Z4V0_9ASTR
MCDKKSSVLFTETKCLVLSPDFKLLNKSQVLLKVPRQNNMYNFDLKNVVPSGGLTYLITKAKIDESNLWHRRLGHINFKTMNKLVRGNLVRGLPSKLFENDHTCVACQKGKQHKDSCKTKLVSSIIQPLQMLHMDLFGPTSVRSINYKIYCLVVTDDYSRFSWVFFLATKYETSEILKTFITGIENQINHKVKIIKCDNRAEFKNNDMNRFCGMKGVKREFSVARTPQQNGVAERKNRTLIEAARTMLADSLLPTTFWAEAVNTACYVQNKVLVTKPHNKTPYELLLGRPPIISFMRPFGCPMTILNTLDPLGKFDEKANEGFLVGYSINSKDFRVFNTRNRKVEENLHINFLENKLNVAGSGPEWLFDIDLLIKSMNYKPEKASDHEYILLPLMLSNSPLSSSTQSTDNKDANKVPDKGDDDVCQRNGQEKEGRASNKEDDQHVQDFRAELDSLHVQQKEGYANSTNGDSTASPSVSTDGPSINTASENINTGSPNINTASPISNDSSIQSLENTDIFDDAYDDREVGAEADLNNLETIMNVSPIPTTRIHKDHPKDQIIGDINSATQTRRMTKISEEHAMVSYIKKQRRKNHKDYQNCLFACFLSQIEPKKVIQALTNLSWIEVMQEELLQFKLQTVWTLVDLPKGKRAIGTKWVYRNKKDERGIIVRNKARLVAQGYTQEKGIDYDKVFAPVARIEAIKLFLAYASFMGLIVYQMDVKSAFLYGTIEEEVYVDDIIFGYTKKSLCVEFKHMMHKRFQMSSMGELTFFLGFTPMEPNKALVKDEEADNVDVHLYRSMIGSLMYLTASRLDITFVVCACARFQVTPKVSHLHAMKRIFRYLKVANYTTEAEYVAAANCCGHVLWIQNQMLDYGFNFINTKIYIDNESTICIVKNPKFHAKTKHIEIRHHFIRDSYEKRLIQVIKSRMDGRTCNIKQKCVMSQTSRQIKRGRDTKIPQSSGPLEKFGDDVVHKELGDRMERATTTASSLEAECQDTILGGVDAQTSMTLNELTVLCTTLSKKVETLESNLKQTKLTYGAAYTNLIMKVKKLEHKVKSSKARRRVRLVISDDEDNQEHEHDFKESNFEFIAPKEDYTAKPDISTTNVPVSTAGAEVSTTSPEVKTTAESLVYIKRSAAKRKDKGKAIMKETEPDNIQAQIEADEELAHSLQAQERERYSEADKERLLVELINERKRKFTQQRAEQRRNKSMNQAQQRTYMFSYIKHMGSHTLQQLKKLSFDEVKELFETIIKRVNTFTPMESDDKVPKVVAVSSKRDAKQELYQESSKRQKIGAGSEPAEESKDELSQKQLQQLMIIVPEEGMNIIRVGNHIEVYHIFEDMLKNFDRDDLVKLWSLVHERFNSTEPTKDKERELWVELKRLFEPDDDDILWKLQRLSIDNSTYDFDAE